MKIRRVYSISNELKGVLSATVLLLLLVFGAPVFSQTPAAGVATKMSCMADSNQQYSLYLPGRYTHEKKYPLIIFFDPAARGNLPVNKYKLLADKYDIILAGSFNSRNFGANNSVESFVAIYNDIISRYAIDSSRIWLSGFSGGARVSSSIAAMYKEVKGVIACGAGFAGNETTGREQQFRFAGIVGNMDMNYGELVDINQYFDEQKRENILLVFDGGHSWAPQEYFETALFWMMKKGSLKDQDSTAIESWMLQRLYEKLDSEFLYPAWFEAEQLKKIPLFSAKAESVSDSIKKLKKFNKDREEYTEILADEKLYINEFSILFDQVVVRVNEPVIARELWQNKAREIENMRKNNDRYRQLSGDRCFDHSWRVCIEYYSQFMDLKQYGRAYAAAEIISFFDPGFINPDFLMARAASGLGNKKLVLKHFKLAIKNGLEKTEQVVNDPFLLQQFNHDELEQLFNK